MAHLETTAVEKAEYGRGCDIEEIKQIDIKDTQKLCGENTTRKCQKFKITI